MTTEQYEYLLQYEHTFYTSAKQSYARMLPRSVNEKLDEILNDHVHRNFGCSACVLNMYRKLYTVLEEEKKRRAEKEPEPIEPEVDKKPKTKKPATNKSKSKDKEIKKEE